MVKYEDFKGCLYGLAIGDALGMPLEFKKVEKRLKDGDYTEMVQGGWLDLPIGTWTDDTSMALCLAHSLLDCRGFNAEDQLKRYTAWLDEGYLSCANKSIGSGKGTRNAIQAFKETGSLVNGDDNSLGNGSLMRLAPVVLYYLDKDTGTIGELCRESSRTTHNSKLCGCFCGMLGVDLSMILTMDKQYWIDTLKNSCYLKSREELGITGHVQVTYENALYSMYNSTTFEQSLITAVNLPGDSDTVGAVCGMIAGAFYGYSNIPQRWIEKLQKKEMIDEVVEKLWNNFKCVQLTFF